MGLGSGILQPSGHCISIHWSWSNLLATFGIIASLRDHTVRARNAEARHGVREKDVPFRAPLLEDATKMSFPRSLSHALDPASGARRFWRNQFPPPPTPVGPAPLLDVDRASIDAAVARSPRSTFSRRHRVHLHQNVGVGGPHAAEAVEREPCANESRERRRKQEGEKPMD